MWMCGCVDMWICGCVTVLLCGYVAVCVFSCVTSELMLALLPLVILGEGAPLPKSNTEPEVNSSSSGITGSWRGVKSTQASLRSHGGNNIEQE